jgi:hypothetical protein
MRPETFRRHGGELCEPTMHADVGARFLPLSVHASVERPYLGTRLLHRPPLSSPVLVNRFFLFPVDDSGRRERITISSGRPFLSSSANRG